MTTIHTRQLTTIHRPNQQQYTQDNYNNTHGQTNNSYTQDSYNNTYGKTNNNYTQDSYNNTHGQTNNNYTQDSYNNTQAKPTTIHTRQLKTSDKTVGIFWCLWTGCWGEYFDLTWKTKTKEVIRKLMIMIFCSSRTSGCCSAFIKDTEFCDLQNECWFWRITALREIGSQFVETLGLGRIQAFLVTVVPIASVRAKKKNTCALKLDTTVASFRGSVKFL